MENSSKDIREKKKRQLESDFTETGVVLNTCLKEKFSDVTKILTVYNNVSERVSANMNAVGKIKRDLFECKGLLNCNREELRRLWLELIEQRRCLELIDVLDRLRNTPDALTTLVSARAWPEATNLLLYATELLKSEVAIVPALQVVKTDLAHKHKFIAEQMKNGLRSLLYDKPTSVVLEKYLKEQHHRSANQVQSTESSPDKSFTPNPSRAPVTSHYSSLPLSAWHTALVTESPSDSNMWKDPQRVAAMIALNASSSEPSQKTVVRSDDKWMKELVDLTHCLARLEKLPQILSDWRPQSHLAQMQHSLMGGLQNIFCAPLVVGQGLLGEIHRFIVLKAISAIESKAIAQGDSGALNTVKKPQYLVELLKLVFDAVFIQARACLLIIRTMKAAKPILDDQLAGNCPPAVANSDVCNDIDDDDDSRLNSTCKELDGLTSDYVWSCVQQEIQLLLSIHLNKHVTVEAGVGVINQTQDQQGSDLSNTMNALDVSHLDLNALMGRKRTTAFSFPTTGPLSVSFQKLTGDSSSSSGTNASNPQNGTGSGQPNSVGQNLFSFSNTSHFLSVTSYLRENRMLLESRPDVPRAENTEVNRNRYPVVCYPDQENIISVYRSVMEFVNAVEHEVALIDSSLQAKASPMGIIRRPCQLRIYLKNFIENTYLPDTLIALRGRLQQKLSAPDALNSIVSQQTEKELGLHRPILSAVLAADQCLMEVKRMSIALPEYGTECLQVGITLIQDFIAAMWRVYRNLSEVDSGGTMVPSADWAKDDDVIRFWKEFPVWRRMEAQEARLWASNALLRTTTTKTSDQPGEGASHETNTIDDSRIAPATVAALGLNTDSDISATSDLNARLVIPFANGRRGSLDATNQSDGIDHTHLSGLLYEREATRLAAKEAVQLIHMIGDEVPVNNNNNNNNNGNQIVQHLPTVRNVQMLKVLGRMTESLCWLFRRVLSLDTWLTQVRRRSQLHVRTSSTTTTSAATSAPPRPRPPLVASPFATCAQELNRLSEACLLMTYLEVRIQAYNHFGGLPSNVTYWCPVDDVDVDKYVIDYLIYLEHVQDMLNVVNRLMEQGVAFDQSVYRDLLYLYQRSHPTHAYAKTEESVVKLASVVNKTLA
ncbi:unnamed protein product [Echinostoma caproni]|uniref:Exocyst complex component Sec8 n=1 Tax=Echinostoma caproni TaxID=27848 RepID=A0A183AAE0_9TREM|nr:unnamed protein product [Echinostoma caproni]